MQITLPQWIVLFRDRYRVLLSMEASVKDMRVREVSDAYRFLLREGKAIQKFCMAKDTGTVDQRLQEVERPVREWLQQERQFCEFIQRRKSTQQWVDLASVVLDVMEAL